MSHDDCCLPETNTDLLGPLPKQVKDRVCALKKLQRDSIQVEAEFYKKVHALEVEFEKQFKPIFDKRSKIISGEYQPTAEECEADIIDGLDADSIKGLYETSKEDAGEKGIPQFWLHVLRSHDLISDTIQEHDVPILNHLIDVTTATFNDPAKFILDFHFSKNEYFTNEVLTKEYYLELNADPEQIIHYDGPQVIRAVGTKIDWIDGKNVTKKAVKKKAKKGASAGKFLTKTVKADSFFNFFDPPTAPADKNEDDEENGAEELLEMDAEVGQAIRDSIIPRAVLFYTGEISSDDMFDFGGEDAEFSEEDDDE